MSLFFFLFLFSGPLQNLRYTPGSARVLQLEGPVVGILYKHGIAFYHTMIEVIPAFLQLGQFMRQNPSMAVAMTCSQVQYRTMQYSAVHYTKRQYSSAILYSSV